MQRGAPSKEGIEEIKQASKGDILALFPTRPDKKTLKAFEKIAQRYYKFLSAASSADEEERCEEDIAKILKTVEERGQKKGKKKILSAMSTLEKLDDETASLDLLMKAKEKSATDVQRQLDTIEEETKDRISDMKRSMELEKADREAQLEVKARSPP